MRFCDLFVYYLNTKRLFMNLSTLAKGMLYLCLAFLSTMALAQTKVVTGKVTDSKTGSGIPSVSVLATGGSAKAGTKTADDGSFKLTVPSGTTKLVFTSVGYEKAEADVRTQSDVSISLKASTDQLNDVVVVGYGTRKVKDLTGSVAAVTTKDFNKGVISTPEQLFQGRTPGVSITPSSGEPGAAATINIRGTSSIRGNNEPLYVVDGVPLDPGGTSGSTSGVEGSTTPKNPLMFLNPNDIESVTILKDASSAAIYGSRGANGVILITTKSGKGVKGAFTFSANTAISQTAKRYDLLNAQDFLLAVKKANIDAGTSPSDAAAAVLSVDKGYNTDWQDQIFRTGVSQNYNLAWGINQKNTNVRLSGSYDDIAGIVKNSGLKRVTVRSNFTQKLLNDKLKIEGSVTYSNMKNQYAPNSNSAGYQGSLIGAAIAFNPTYPVYNSDGSFFDPLDGNRNPVEMLNYFDDRDVINRVLANISASLKLTNDLTYKITFGYDNSKSIRTSFADPRLSTNAFGGTWNVFGVDYGNQIQGNGRATRQNLNYNSYLVEHTLTYDKNFKNGHNLNAVAGFSYQNFRNDNSGRIRWGLGTPVVAPTDVFVKNWDGGFKYDSLLYLPSDVTTELQSFFGRINYTIGNKYYFTGTLRIDGSSKFGADNRYGTFPAFAVKWKVLNENFAANSLAKVFNDFSVRANYGILGSQDGLDAYSAKGHIITYNGNTQNVLVKNSKLKWEQAATTGVGIDFALKGTRLSGTVDYYYTKRSNILFYGPTPGGYSASALYFSNLPGYVLNKGVEVSLNYGVINKKNFTWDINYNMTFQHNEVRNLGTTYNTGSVSGQGLSGAYAQVIADGHSLFTWKMPVFLGFNGNGDARYANGAQDQLLGSALPKFMAGLTNSFTLGKWSASFTFTTSKGFYIYNNTANALFLRGSIKTAHNVTYAVANSPEDPINPGSVSSRFLEKGDFIRLSNALISYNFNVKNKYIKSLSATVTGQNLLLITNYSGLDPEVNVDKNINGYPSRGFDYAGYPKPRTVSLGINVGF